MLEEVRIRGLGVIDDAVLELGPGLTVLTGETGAGKTMVLQGLALLCGRRADPGLVRPGAERALVEGRFRLADGSAALLRADEAGAERDEDGSLIAVRAVSAEGRSRAWVGGRVAPATLLAELADDLVAVHGQHETLRLLRPAAQREALDRFAGPAAASPLAAYQEAYARLQQVDAELAEGTAAQADRDREVELLRLGLADVEAADPQPGEDVELAARVLRMSDADDLRRAAGEAHALLAGDDAAFGGSADAGALVADAARVLERVRGSDPAVAALADRVAEVGVLLADAAADLASYGAGVEADPAALAAAQDRQAELARLVRRYAPAEQPDLAGVLAWAARAAARVLELDGTGDRLAALEAEREALLRRSADAAAALSVARHAAAATFGERVGEELRALAMPAARVEAVVSDREVGPDEPGLEVGGRRLAFGPHGVDEVELRLAPHPGAPARSLQKGASGGELSRVVLAVEVVFAGSDPVPTLVFDEVDAGVGGRAAVEVGRLLARLGRRHQVLVVTHLPQVAAFADRHLHVRKASDGSVTRSGVQLLDEDARAAELSRMLSGLDGSGTGRAHAVELLEHAARARREATPEGRAA